MNTYRLSSVLMVLLFALGIAVMSNPGQIPPSDPAARYSGMSDASAAVALDSETFIVADDERNTFAVYAAVRPGPPLARIPWNEHLQIDPETDEHPEADIEGVARVGNRIYWISSHGRNKSGKWRANRHQFFAMQVRKTADGFTAEPIGQSYHDLAVRMVADPRLKALGVERALDVGDEKVKDLAPKQEGFNIEGLAATPDGDSLLLALRNPRPEGKALLVPLQNPAEVLTSGASPMFGAPIMLDLTLDFEGETVELGIRSIHYSERHRRYLIVAGPHDDRKVFALFAWSGNPDDSPERLVEATAAIADLPDFSPEALIEYPGRDEIQLLSDDGSLLVPVDSPAECEEGEFKDGMCKAKHLLDDARKTFRSVMLVIPSP